MPRFLRHTHTPRRLTVGCVLAALCLFTATVHAGEISLPLTVHDQVLDQSLLQQWQPSAGQPVTLLQEGPCRYLKSEQARIEHRNGDLRFVTRLAASIGVDMFGKCQDAASFHGSIELRLEPYIDPDWQLRFRVLDSSLYDRKGQKAPLLGFMWDLSKRYIHPRLELLGYDLSAPREEILGLLRVSVAASATRRFEEVLATLSLGQATVISGGITIPMHLQLPAEWEQPLPPQPVPATLDEATIAAYQARMERWDAFLVFVIKGAGLDIGDTDTRQRLLDLLIDSRYRLLDILGSDQPASQIDPVRGLFIEVWNELRDILMAAEKQGLIRDQLLRYMMFINAGDALLALDASAPGLGIEISADGLRRLAHTLRPTVTDDPLQYDQQVDRELREVFSFGAEPAATPLPPDGMRELPAETSPDASPDATITPEPVPAEAPAAVDAPTAPDASPGAPPTTPPVTPPATPEEPAPTVPQPVPADVQPTSWLQQVLDWMILPAAAAADTPKASALGQRLHRWVPKAGELDEYQSLVQELLDYTANEALQDSGLNDAQASIFMHLLPATALIESCWRQFTIKGKQVTYLRSAAGSVGMLQINQNVWRGFYDVDRLKWDVAYNSQAGAQILLRYMKRYGVQIAAKTGNIDHIARATYAAYNAGPRAAGRFLTSTSSRVKQVDDRLWRYYHGLATGGQLDLKECGVKTAKANAP